MNHAIAPKQVGTATVLRIADGWRQSLGSLPTFHYYLDSAGGVTLQEGDCQMTQDQWDSWSDDVSDEEYITAAVAENLGLTLA